MSEKNSLPDVCRESGCNLPRTRHSVFCEGHHKAHLAPINVEKALGYLVSIVCIALLVFFVSYSGSSGADEKEGAAPSAPQTWQETPRQTPTDTYVATVVVAFRQARIAQGEFSPDRVRDWTNRLRSLGLALRSIPTKDVESELVAAVLKCGDASRRLSDATLDYHQRVLEDAVMDTPEGEERIAMDAAMLGILGEDWREPLKFRAEVAARASRARDRFGSAVDDFAVARADLLRVIRTHSTLGNRRIPELEF